MKTIFFRNRKTEENFVGILQQFAKDAASREGNPVSGPRYRRIASMLNTLGIEYDYATYFEEVYKAKLWIRNIPEKEYYLAVREQAYGDKVIGYAFREPGFPFFYVVLKAKL